MDAENFARIEASGISVQRLVAIIAIQNEIARAGRGLDHVMAMVVERAMALTHAHGAVVELVDGDMMLYRAVSGSAAEFAGARIPRATSLSGRCIREGVALYAADTASDPRVDQATCQRIGVGSMVCVPLLHLGQPVGVLKVLSSVPHAFDPAAEVTVALLADVIAAAMHVAREYDHAVTMSLEDALTGLLNRRAFERQLTAAIAAGAPLSVAVFDLDGLKAANDTFGHAAGDDILRDAARALRGALRTTDTCFRLGGDEFAVVLPAAGELHARQVAQRCCAGVLAARLGHGTVGISGGVAELRAGETWEAVVARADAELYADKARNRAARALAVGSTPPFRPDRQRAG